MSAPPAAGPPPTSGRSPGTGLPAPAGDPPSVVVWDLGNVLIPWDRLGALAVAEPDRDEARRLAAEVFTMEVNVHLDAGRPLGEIRAIVERENPGHGWVVDSYVEHFRHSLGEQISGSVALVDELLADGVRCVGLSNWSRLTFEDVPEAYPALQRLEGIVISGDVGVCKPDPAIYRHCEARFAFTAADALFIDDSPDNVAGAHAVGWDAVVFTDPDALRADLAERGLC